MTPSNTSHRLAREATAAELAEEAKRLAGEYGLARCRNNEFDNSIGVDRTRKDLFAAIDRLASLALPQLEEQQRWMQPGQPEQTR